MARRFRLIDFRNDQLDLNGTQEAMVPREGKHVVEVLGVDGRWIVYSFGTFEQCERGAARYRAAFGSEARVRRHGEV